MRSHFFVEPTPDYLIPCLALPPEKEQPIGLFGWQHLDYLKQHRKVTYTNLLTSGKLNAYLADIDRQAQERFYRLIEGMKQAQGIQAPKRRKHLRMDRTAQRHKGMCEGDCERGNHIRIGNMAAEDEISVVFLFGKLLKRIFYSDTLYASLQKIAEKERKYKAD